MRKTSWVVATATVVLGFGFGHMGCYTSGTPGGNGAGGTPSSTAGGANGGASNGGANNGGAGATAGTTACTRNVDCSARANNLHACRQDTGACVRCNADIDCVVPADAGVGGAGGAGGTTSAADQYCYQKECHSFEMCSTRGLCADKITTCDIAAKHCVACLSTSDCTSGTVCAANLCRTTCQGSDFACQTSTGICSTTNGAAGFCTESCSINSDCFPGYNCVDGLCQPPV